MRSIVQAKELEKATFAEFTERSLRVFKEEGGSLPQAEINHHIQKLRAVRHHSNWNTWRPDLREDLAHLVQDIKRRIPGIASAGFQSFCV